MDNLTSLTGPAPPDFNYDIGTARYQNLTELDPHNILLIPPKGAPPGIVGLNACEKLAGPDYGGYGAGNALDSPLLVLVGNMNYATFIRHKYWNQIAIALHLHNNPIDAIRSLLTKLDVKRRIESRFRDSGLATGEIWIYATTLYALDDFGSLQDFPYHFEKLMEIALFGQEDEKNVCERAAIDIILARVGNTRRTVLAILGYLAAITANILRAALSSDIPLHLPHTIAPRVLHYWLITALIVSAALGGPLSEWTAISIPKELESKTELKFGI